MEQPKHRMTLALPVVVGTLATSMTVAFTPPAYAQELPPETQITEAATPEKPMEGSSPDIDGIGSTIPEPDEGYQPTPDDSNPSEPSQTPEPPSDDLDDPTGSDQPEAPEPPTVEPDSDHPEDGSGPETPDTPPSENAPSDSGADTELDPSQKPPLTDDAPASSDKPETPPSDANGSTPTDPDAPSHGTEPSPDAPTATQPTQNQVEATQLPAATAVVHSDGWVSENGSWYYYTNNKKSSGWLVTNKLPGASSAGALERYWLDPSTGQLATSRLVSASEAGYWAFARPDGTIVRGKWTNPSTGYVYLADNDGRLVPPGWHVTGAYTGGNLQRYWIDGTAHACIPGFSADGYAHYTLSEGYVLRGAKSISGGTLLANNDGRLESRSGWVVTSEYTPGALQRYWLEEADGYSVAKQGLFSVGNSFYYGTPSGYVVRGRYAESSRVYFADNDGRLIGGKNGGWVVTGAFTGGALQRYWVDPTSHACIPGFSSDGYAHYTLPEGYVLRGKRSYDGRVLLANNDGRLATTRGWVVTGAYDGSLHRYWLEDCGGGMVGAKTGFFKIDGATYYGTSEGYVLHGTARLINGTWYSADNDGKLTAGGNAMWARAQQYASSTGYLILIDSSSHTVGVFQGSQYHWNMIHSWPCGNGAWLTPTVKGIFTVSDRGYSFGSGYTCYYWTQFYGDYLFHSILYWPGTHIVQDGTLGASVSHGCVRLSIENAKWIYDNIPRGTTVVSY